MGTVDKIYDNFEMLYDSYTDMAETRETRNRLFRHMEEQGLDMVELESYITPVISEYEKQGFLYGFRYAVSLFLDGMLQHK